MIIKFQNGGYNINSSSSGNFKGYIKANPNGELTTFNNNGKLMSTHGSVMLPEVNVQGTRPLELYTYNPLSKGYLIGHSAIVAKSYSPLGDLLLNVENKIVKSKDYNILTNNCSDGTREVLELAYGKKINPILFTTPGDVRDFAIDSLGATPSKDNPHILFIPINKYLKDRAIQKIQQLNNYEGGPPMIKYTTLNKKYLNGGIFYTGNRLIPLNIAQNSKANFVSRLYNPNRKVITNWDNHKLISTHKMSSSDNIVFPMILLIGDKLKDYTNPIYNSDWRDALGNAIKNKDFLEMQNPEQADWFANNYKNYYPQFKKYLGGGTVPYFLQKQVPHHTVWLIATLIGRMKNKPNIVKRMESGALYGLKNYITNYNNPSLITSFKMSYGEFDGKNYAFPLVQLINGKLVDFEDPKNGGELVGMRNAFKNKDIIPMSSEADADYFTNNNYKVAYPNVIRPDYFNAKKYLGGGIL